MDQSKEKLKPKFLIPASKKKKLSIQVSQKVADLIESYRAFHKEVSGEEVSTDALISAVINSALASDKDFVKWRRERSKINEPSQKWEAS